MIDSIVNNIDDKKLQSEINKDLKLVKKKINGFLKSSDFSLSVINRHPELILDFISVFKKNTIKYNSKENKSDIIINYKNYLENKYSNFFAYYNYDILFKELRLIKNIEMVLIGINDYLNKVTFEEVTAEISVLADFCINNALNASIAKLNNKNITIDEIKNKIIIIGMGKLGGLELNYSSDIDLILFCDDDYLLNEEKQKHLYKLIKLFLDFLRRITAEGFLYRVDLRLRPEGNIGPIIMGINSAVDYYKSRGRNWEYQAFIKSRLIWGNNKLFDKLQEALTPLIYYHIQPEDILNEIKEIKDKIEKKISHKLKTVNLKLSPGGIRDIEFIIQFLQLVHGIRYHEIRSGNSLKGLKSLRVFNIITDHEYYILRNNYIFLRKLENILQLSNNLSDNIIPDNYEKLIVLFKGWDLFKVNDDEKFTDELLTLIYKSMNDVRCIFKQIFDDTIQYINLKNKIIKNNPDIPIKFIENHFLRLDSEYFLRFNEYQIADHIKMVMKLTYNNLLEIEVKKKEENFYDLIIVAFDYTYEFAKIAGALTCNYLEIIEGESFTYSLYDEKNIDERKKHFFYRRQSKIINKHILKDTDDKNILKRRKIVCFIRVKPFINNVINWENFKSDLNLLLNLLENNQFEKAAENLNIKIINVFKKAKLDFDIEVNPVEITVDNESSNQYTIINTRSKNVFAFLYILTSVLAMRNYYIFKVEISTVDNMADDRLFIITRDGNKILSAKKIKELEITIMMIKQFTLLLFNAINPNKALNYFDQLLTRIFESDKNEELPILGQKDVLEKLAKIFGISDFIWEDLFRFNYKTMLPLMNDEIIAHYKNKTALLKLFKIKYCDNKNYNDIEFVKLVELINKFKEEQRFIIDLRQILKKIDFWQFAVELTDLADMIIEVLFNKIESEMLVNYNFNIIPPWSVFGLGKLGGMELGFASDIELMFIYDIPDDINDNFLIHDYFEKIVIKFIKSVITKREGIFKVDLNLRPYGKKGKLAVSFENFKKYFSKNGDAYFFEKQALTKMRFICSNQTGGYLEKEILKAKDDFVYNNSYIDFDSINRIRKKQIDNYINNLNEINVKYSYGGLVDIEYIVQVLQIKYGYGNKNIRKTSTLDVLDALYENNFINEKYYSGLKEVYIFYRNLINILRMVKGNSKDLTINQNNKLKFDYLIKRSVFIGIIENESKDELLDKLNNHMKFVSECFNKIKIDLI